MSKQKYLVIEIDYYRSLLIPAGEYDLGKFVALIGEGTMCTRSGHGEDVIFKKGGKYPEMQFMDNVEIQGTEQTPEPVSTPIVVEAPVEVRSPVSQIPDSDIPF